MKIHTSCYNLPLSLFIRCICDEDHTAIVIEGEPTVDEIAAAWQIIYQEYLELCGTTGQDYQTALTVEVMKLYMQHLSITEAVDLLRKIRYDELVAMLKQQGYNFQFNHNDLEAYHKDLDRVLNRSKTILVQKEQKEAQLAALQAGQKGDKITRAYFDSRLNALSVHYKYHINENDITVSRYVNLLNQYFKDCEQLKAQHARHHR